MTQIDRLANLHVNTQPTHACTLLLSISCRMAKKAPAEILNLMLLSSGQHCFVKPFLTFSQDAVLPKFLAGIDVSDGFLMDPHRLGLLGSKNCLSCVFLMLCERVLITPFHNSLLILIGRYSCALSPR